MTLATQTALLALLERIASALERAHPLPDPPVRLANTPDAAPEPDADGWIEWPGGSGVCPIPSDWTITARLRSDVIVTRPAKAFRWHHLNWASDLVAFRITQAVPPEPASEPDADGWIEWHGGECPVPGDTPVDIRLRAGIEIASSKALDLGKCYKASDWTWTHNDHPGDIIAYRIAR